MFTIHKCNENGSLEFVGEADTIATAHIKLGANRGTITSKDGRSVTIATAFEGKLA